MNARQEPVKTGSNQMELVDFRILEEQEDGQVYEGIYGINIAKVREIIILPTLSKVPDSHPAIEGIFNLRGVQVPAVNLARWMKTKEAYSEGVGRKVIVIEFSMQTIGLIVHQASRIRRVSWESIKPPPALVTQKHGASIVGTTMIGDDKTMLLVDVEKIIAEMHGDKLEDGVEEHLKKMGGNRQRASLMVIDDSGVARRQMVLTLRKAGYDIIEAEDGKDALDRIRSLQREARQEGKRITDKIDIVISDVEMPRMDGYSLVTILKKDEELKELPVFMHSSLSGEANIDKGKSAGCDEYLVKFRPEKLLEAVGQYLEYANAEE